MLYSLLLLLLLRTVLCGALYTACVDTSRMVFWDRSIVLCTFETAKPSSGSKVHAKDNVQVLNVETSTSNINPDVVIECTNSGKNQEKIGFLQLDFYIQNCC